MTAAVLPRQIAGFSKRLQLSQGGFSAKIVAPDRRVMEPSQSPLWQTPSSSIDGSADYGELLPTRRTSVSKTALGRYKHSLLLQYTRTIQALAAPTVYTDAMTSNTSEISYAVLAVQPELDAIEFREIRSKIVQLYDVDEYRRSNVVVLFR